MFVGHFGVAFAAKRLAPRTSLGMLVFAAQFADFLWPILLLLGVEHVRIAPGITAMSPLDFYDYPISHSLVTLLGWSALVGGGYFFVRRYRAGAWVVAAAVFSHWVLDFIVHRPDLPIVPSSPTRVGLGLWNSWPAGLTVESLIFLVGLWIYLRTTRARDAIGRWALWSLVVVLAGGWISTLLAGPPPSLTALAWGAMVMWITVPWARWADSHRFVVGNGPGP